MTQPRLGLIATAATIALSLVFVSRFDFPSFAGPVSFFLLCTIPAQIVMVVLWGARLPFAPHLPQPAHGAGLLALTVAIGALVMPLVLWLVGEGVSPPGPIPSHFAIIVVPTTFWLAIMWGGWPFTAVVRQPVLSALAVLVASYALTYAIFRIFFDYGFLQGTPAYLPSAPHGLFNAVNALVFDVTCLAVMFVILCCDLWPFTRRPALMTQPILGLVWTLTALAGGGLAMFLGVAVVGADPMVFLTRVTAPFIFGAIIVLNMLQGSLFSRAAPAAKRVLNVLTAMVAGAGLAAVYGALAPIVTGVLPSGPPGYEYEIWLANALLSVTFPLLIVVAAYFDFWPLRRATAASPSAPAATTVP